MCIIHLQTAVQVRLLQSNIQVSENVRSTRVCYLIQGHRVEMVVELQFVQVGGIASGKTQDDYHAISIHILC